MCFWEACANVPGVLWVKDEAHSLAEKYGLVGQIIHINALHRFR